MRVFGWAMLLLSLLGWSAWWVICNVYEFAPALPNGTLACAWLMGLLGVALGRKWPWLAWALAGINGLYLLALHRQIQSGLGVAMFALWLVLLCAVYMMGRRKQQRPA